MLRKIAVMVAVGFAVAPAPRVQAEEFFRVARVSFVEGNVSFQHQGDPDWGAVTINLSLQPGDRLYTGRDGRVEVEFDDGSVLRLAEETDLELLSMGEGLVQMRQLLGLSTLTVRSGLEYEVGTPAAAFRTQKKGVYRFDVVESGDSDGIVRKGHLEATNGKFTTRADSGELIHVTAGENARYLISHYDRRDDWDDWNDRRNAELNAYESRKYLPDYVYVGVSDLDYYGRWVVVDGYGPAWVPSGIGYGWSPYWEGRWIYRPYWGWTWVSYEPWGWLPYHYGRWHHSVSFGWCWLPGVSFGFHFWSPGLVRFHRGPGWVSWTPLGPRDYYNVHNYFYNPRYSGHVNDLRLAQGRAPSDLENRHVPGAVRTVSADSFVGERLGSRGRAVSLVTSDRGRVVTDRLDLQPTRRSFLPDPDRPVSRPGPTSARTSIVRAAPSVASRPGDVRVVQFGPETRSTVGAPGRSPTRGEASSPVGGRNPERSTQVRTYESAGGTLQGPGMAPNRSSIWNRSPQPANPSEGPAPRVYSSPSRSVAVPPVAASPSRPGVSVEASQGLNPGNSASENSRSSRGREIPGILSPRSVQAPGSRQVAPAAPPARIESAPSRGTQRPQPTAPPRNNRPGVSSYPPSGSSFPGLREWPASRNYQSRSFSPGIARGFDQGRTQGAFSQRFSPPTPAPRANMGSPMRSAPATSPSSIFGGRSLSSGAQASRAPASRSGGGRSGRRN